MRWWFVSRPRLIPWGRTLILLLILAKVWGLSDALQDEFDSALLSQYQHVIMPQVESLCKTISNLPTCFLLSTAKFIVTCIYSDFLGIYLKLGGVEACDIFSLVEKTSSKLGGGTNSEISLSLRQVMPKLCNDVWVHYKGFLTFFEGLKVKYPNCDHFAVTDRFNDYTNAASLLFYVFRRYDVFIDYAMHFVYFDPTFCATFSALNVRLTKYFKAPISAPSLSEYLTLCRECIYSYQQIAELSHVAFVEFSAFFSSNLTTNENATKARLYSSMLRDELALVPAVSMQPCRPVVLETWKQAWKDAFEYALPQFDRRMTGLIRSFECLQSLTYGVTYQQISAALAIHESHKDVRPLLLFLNTFLSKIQGIEVTRIFKYGCSKSGITQIVSVPMTMSRFNSILQENIVKTLSAYVSDQVKNPDDHLVAILDLADWIFSKYLPALSPALIERPASAADRYCQYLTDPRFKFINASDLKKIKHFLSQTYLAVANGQLNFNDVFDAAQRAIRNDIVLIACGGCRQRTLDRVLLASAKLAASHDKLLGPFIQASFQHIVTREKESKKWYAQVKLFINCIRRILGAAKVTSTPAVDFKLFLDCLLRNSPERREYVFTPNEEILMIEKKFVVQAFDILKFSFVRKMEKHLKSVGAFEDKKSIQCFTMISDVLRGNPYDFPFVRILGTKFAPYLRNHDLLNEHLQVLLSLELAKKELHINRHAVKSMEWYLLPEFAPKPYIPLGPSEEPAKVPSKDDLFAIISCLDTLFMAMLPQLESTKQTNYESMTVEGLKHQLSFKEDIFRRIALL